MSKGRMVNYVRQGKQDKARTMNEIYQLDFLKSAYKTHGLPIKGNTPLADSKMGNGK